MNELNRILELLNTGYKLSKPEIKELKNDIINNNQELINAFMIMKKNRSNLLNTMFRIEKKLEKEAEAKIKNLKKKGSK